MGRPHRSLVRYGKRAMMYFGAVYAWKMCRGNRRSRVGVYSVRTPRRWVFFEFKQFKWVFLEIRKISVGILEFSPLFM